jgi:hypothetical protein
MPNRLRGRTFEEFVIDEEIVSGTRTVTEADVVDFAGLSGDFQPEHMNEEYAKKGPMGARIAHGLLVLSMATGLLNQTGAFEGTSVVQNPSEQTSCSFASALRANQSQNDIAYGSSSCVDNMTNALWKDFCDAVPIITHRYQTRLTASNGTPQYFDHEGE